MSLWIKYLHLLMISVPVTTKLWTAIEGDVNVQSLKCIILTAMLS